MTINFDMNEVFLNSELIKSGETRTTITANFPVTDIPTEEIHEVVDLLGGTVQDDPKDSNSKLQHYSYRFVCPVDCGIVFMIVQ